MSDSEKRIRTFGRVGKVISIIFMVLAAIIAVAFIIGTAILVIAQKALIKGGELRWWAKFWSGKILGIEQSFSTVCGITLGFGILFVGLFFICLIAAKYFGKVIIAKKFTDFKCEKALKGFGFAAMFIPIATIVLDYIGMIIEHLIFEDCVLMLDARLGIIAGAALGAYVALNFGFAIAAFVFAGLKKAFEVKEIAKAEEPVEEKEEPAQETEPVEEVKKEEVSEEPAEEIAEEAEEEVAATENGKKTSVGYDRSFAGKLMQTKDETKAYYSDIKNAILSYKGKGKHISDRISWKYETFNIGRNKVVKMKVKGKTLCVYLALDPKTYIGTKYKVEDVSDSKTDDGTPLMYRITNARRAKYVLALIATAMEKYEFAISENAKPEDYAKGLKFKNDAKLVKEGLAKKVVVSSFPKL